MRKAEQSPSLVQDLTTLGDLYLTVFSMIGRRVKYGPGWPLPAEKMMASRMMMPPRAPVTAGRKAQANRQR